MSLIDPECPECGHCSIDALILQGERVCLCQACGFQTSESGRFDRDALARLTRVWVSASRTLGRPEKARRFLEAPHPLLNQAISLALICESEAGADRVLALLGRIQYGIPV